MSTFGLNYTDSIPEIIDAVNYAISNLGQGINGVVANAQTGIVSTAYASTSAISYLYQYINVRYATNSTGTENFSESPTNAFYYGIQNVNSPTLFPQAGSNNPADYAWYSAGTGGFGTTKFLFYSTLGGRQITFYIGTTLPAGYAQVLDGVAINLDTVTTTSTAQYADEAGQAAIANVAITADTANTSNSSVTATNAIHVTANAQANITSVGTLTSLTVSGNVSAGFYNGNGSRLSNITGGNVVGSVPSAVLAGNVTNPIQANITSVGNLANLTVSTFLTVGNNISCPGLIYSANNVGSGNLVTTVHLQASNSVFAGNTINANGRISGNGLVSSSTVSAAGNITGNTLRGNSANIGGWVMSLTPTNGLLFSYGGANRMVLNTDGSLIVSGNVTPNGTVI